MKLNKTNKRALCFIEAYKNCSNTGELYQVYGSFSKNKTKALEHCKELVYKTKGNSPKIISANSNTFTYAFKIGHDLAVITKENEYKIEGVF